MANRFIGLDDAAAQLGVSKEQLNEIRESGKVRAYRDGVSWKFRTEDIESLAGSLQGGGQESGIDLGSDLSLDSGGLSSLDFDMGGGDRGKPGEEKPAEVSDLDLASLEDPTVPVDADVDDDNESILLSEDELGDLTDRPPSTIIGRSQLRNEPSDDDLRLAPAAEQPKADTGLSDVRLAEEDDDLGALLSGAPNRPGAEKFEDLEELEFDLEAESSRILESQDVAAAQAAAAQMAQKPDSGSSLDIGGGPNSKSDAGATGVHHPAGASQSDAFSLAADEDDELELDLAASDAVLQSSADLKSDGSDDMVLDSSDDDLALSAGDSGINLKPSDSGLALDDDSFDLGGSAIGSSLDLGDSFAVGGESLAMGGSEASLEGSTAFASSPDFNLQPSDDNDDEDEEDSSQIIALEAVEDSLDDDEPILTGAGAVSMGMPGASATPVLAQEATFPVWIVAFLGLSAFLMAIASIMAADLVRTMWAWNEPWSVNSPLIEGFLGLIGMNN